MTVSVQFKSLGKMQIWLKTKFNGLIVQNGNEFGTIVARMKQIPGTVLYFEANFGAGLYGI